MTRLLANPDDATAWLRSRLDTPGAQLRTDSRHVLPGDAFIAWPGYATDGRQHVAAALAAGAALCLVEAEGLDAFGFDAADARIAALAGLKAATGPIAAAWFGHPGRQLQVVAVTATNGKSSTAWWTAQALTALGRRCGVVGTLGIGEPPLGDRPGSVRPTGLTTPDPVTLQAALRRMVDEGYAACAVEASSIGLVEHRLAGTPIGVAQFINFTPDHLDFHGDMDRYWAAKRSLFSWPGLGTAVVDLDDPRGPPLAAELAAQGLPCWTTAVAGNAAAPAGQETPATAQPAPAWAPARLQAQGLHYSAEGLAFTLVERLAEGGQAQVAVRSRLIGDYNLHNLLAMLGALRALGVPLADAAAVVPQLSPVPGRMQRVPQPVAGHGVPASLPEVVVDYAHTPDALDKALSALQPMTIARGGRLWVVFGCGGNRDAGKRPVMGRIAQQLADRVVLTSDNPRHEAPGQILAQILGGMAPGAHVEVIEDRAAAIQHALNRAEPADVVLVAGKGHEDYQEVAGTRRTFLDLAVAADALQARLARSAAPAAGAGVGAVLPTAPVPLMSLCRASQLLPGARLVGDAATTISRVHTDTRSLRPGDLFVALRGERFDAHDFLPQAKAAGAAAVLVETDPATAGLPGLQVADSLAALQQLATGWRAQHQLPVLAVTGSNGKTTVTQMLAAILRAWQGDAALATAGNLNNHIGLPLTVLRLHAGHRAAVLELGMNHPGEIAQLAAMAQPTVALVNNAQREHQEFMATVAAVAQENGSVISALPADGVAVFPADDAHASVWRGLAGSRRTLSFATTPGVAADITADAAWVADAQGGAWQVQLHTPAGAAALALRVAGRHNLHNALAASAAALAAGVPLAVVVQGLQQFQPVAGRSQLGATVLHGHPVALVDDSYNANPDSVRAAIDLLAGLPGPHWLVLGDMGEVGDQGPAFHAEVGAHARGAGITHFWSAGSGCAHAAQAFGAGARHFAQVPDLIAALDSAPDCAAALVKGSRFMRMETVVQALKQRAAPHTP